MHLSGIGSVKNPNSDQSSQWGNGGGLFYHSTNSNLKANDDSKQIGVNSRYGYLTVDWRHIPSQNEGEGIHNWRLCGDSNIGSSITEESTNGTHTGNEYANYGVDEFVQILQGHSIRISETQLQHLQSFLKCHSIKPYLHTERFQPTLRSILWDYPLNFPLVALFVVQPGCYHHYILGVLCCLSTEDNFKFETDQWILYSSEGEVLDLPLTYEKDPINKKDLSLHPLPIWNPVPKDFEEYERYRMFADTMFSTPGIVGPWGDRMVDLYRKYGRELLKKTLEERNGGPIDWIKKRKVDLGTIFSGKTENGSNSVKEM